MLFKGLEHFQREKPIFYDPFISQTEEKGSKCFDPQACARQIFDVIAETMKV